MRCPVCKANWDATSIDERPCLCRWSEPTRAVLRGLITQRQNEHEAAVKATAWALELVAERDRLRDVLLGAQHVLGLLCEPDHPVLADIDAALKEGQP